MCDWIYGLKLCEIVHRTFTKQALMQIILIKRGTDKTVRTTNIK